jgi:uncharacterized membrane protein YdbT with pleckstrin-like domain
MAYIDKNLIPGEEVIYRTRLHWIVIFWHLLFAIIFALAGLFLIFGLPHMDSLQGSPGSYLSHYGWMGGVAFLVFALIFIISSFVRRNSVEMAVTNKRVTVKVGLISRSTEEMMLTRIESIMVDQSLFGRMMNYGTITLRGVGGTPDPFPNIAHPLEFRRQVQHQLDLQQGPTPPSAPMRPLT